MTYLAVFDWNGTLFDDTAATLVATNACLASFGRPPIDKATMQNAFSFPLIHFYERLGISADEYLARAEDEANVFLEAYETAAASCHVMDGAVELLNWLNGHGVHCMVLSNHLQDRLDLDVRRLGLDHFMKTISGNETKATITQGLSKRLRLEDYMMRHGFAAKDSFIVGDSHEEPDVARQLGLLGISIAGGLLSPERLEQYKADYIVTRLAEIRPILEKRWNL